MHSTLKPYELTYFAIIIIMIKSPQAGTMYLKTYKQVGRTASGYVINRNVIEIAIWPSEISKLQKL